MQVVRGLRSGVGRFFGLALEELLEKQQRFAKVKSK